MATQAGVGISRNRNPEVAGREAVAQALGRAKVERCDLAIMYATIGYDQQAIHDAVRAAVAPARVVGCSAEGVIADGEVDESNFSVAVMVVKSDELRFDPHLVRGLKERSLAVGEELAELVNPNIAEDSLALVTIGDGITINFDKFLAGLQQKLRRPLPLIGGTAADNFEMVRTYQYLDGEVTSDAMVGMLISGKASVAWDVNHGCVPIDVERKVTKARGNKILEIDNRPVLEVLKDYLLPDEIDSWDRTVVNLCLGFKAPSSMKGGYDEFFVRFMPQRDVAEGSVIIPTEVAEGTSVWMTRRDQEKIFDGCSRIGEKLKATLEGRTPKLVLHFDCAGRGKFVFRDAERLKALGLIRDRVSTEAPWLGFYTFGEIGPVNGQNCFHNYTAVVAVFY